MSFQKKLIVAFDQSERAAFLASVQEFKDLPIVVKVGLRLLPKLHQNDLLELKQKGYEIFVDAKLHDIPTQVADAVETWAGMGADYLTVHLSGGQEMLRLAQTQAKQKKVQLLGVSVLTSLANSDLHQIGVPDALEIQVPRLIQLGIQSGLQGFVCSPREVPLLQNLSAQAFFVCPGIHLDGTQASSDQKRSVALSEAIKLGVHMPVMGRALFKSKNPRMLAKEIAETLRGSA